MLVYYFVPFIVSNRYILFRDSNGHNSVTVQNRTHVCMNFFDHKDLGNHLLQLCPKVVKHPVYIYIYIFLDIPHTRHDIFEYLYVVMYRTCSIGPDVTTLIQHERSYSHQTQRFCYPCASNNLSQGKKIQFTCAQPVFL